MSPHQIRLGDRGLVVVGASLEMGDVATGEGLEGTPGETPGCGGGWRGLLRRQTKGVRSKGLGSKICSGDATTAQVARPRSLALYKMREKRSRLRSSCK